MYGCDVDVRNKWFVWYLLLTCYFLFYYLKLLGIIWIERLINPSIRSSVCFSDTSIAIVTDSLLSHVVYSDNCFLKPERTFNTRVCVDLRKQVPPNMKIFQFSYSGLKAFSTHHNGFEDRKVFLEQLNDVFSG